MLYYLVEHFALGHIQGLVVVEQLAHRVLARLQLVDHGLHVLVIVDVRLLLRERQPPSRQLPLDLLSPLCRLIARAEEDEEIVHIAAVAPAPLSPSRRARLPLQGHIESLVEPLHEAQCLLLHQVVLVRGELLLHEPVELVQVQVGQEMCVRRPLGQAARPRRHR